LKIVDLFLFLQIYIAKINLNIANVSIEYVCITGIMMELKPKAKPRF
tara:strand:+ start:584 stop:724 length:141 start_codon:yes stop_codon:yes gene_type:complete